MFRTVLTAELDGRKTRTRVRVESDPCEQGTPLYEQTRHHMINAIANDPSLIHCGSEPFQILKMSFNGEKWIIEAEAIVERR